MSASRYKQERNEQGVISFFWQNIKDNGKNI